jgi:hypothetical protein
MERILKTKLKIVTRRHPTKSKDDLTVEHHGSIVLLVPITKKGVNFIQQNIGADNGYQPYYPTVLFEPKYVEDVIEGARNLGLVVR